jgi:hypothetical protein
MSGTEMSKAKRVPETRQGVVQEDTRPEGPGPAAGQLTQPIPSGLRRVTSCPIIPADTNCGGDRH